MNFYAIFKINLIENLSKNWTVSLRRWICGPHSNPTPVNGHQINPSAYEDTATGLKKAMTHLRRAYCHQAN